jgi:hypothetical protein
MQGASVAGNEVEFVQSFANGATSRRKPLVTIHFPTPHASLAALSLPEREMNPKARRRYRRLNVSNFYRPL